MCIICGDLEVTDTKHLEKTIHSLSDSELEESLSALRKQLKNAQILGADPEVVKNLRRVAIVLIVEKNRR